MASIKPSDLAPRLGVRFPPDIKEWLVREAERNKSTQTTEIIRRLRAAKDRETSDAR